MLWASDGPDGGPGVAIWDLYTAEDADKVCTIPVITHRHALMTSLVAP